VVTALVVYGTFVVALAFLTLVVARARVAKQGGRAEAVSASRGFWTRTIRLGAVLAIVRVSVLWYLMYREWSGTQSLSAVLLVLLLYPEGAMMSHAAFALNDVVLLSSFLIIGSIAIAASLLAVASAIERL
jgi:hypothetical protein